MAIKNIFAVFCLFVFAAVAFGAVPNQESFDLENTSDKLTAIYPWETNPLMEHVEQSGWKKLREIYADIQDLGCDTNLFFLLEGTNAITAEEFEDQKNFADLIIAITTTDSGGNFGAIEYNRRANLISGITGSNDRFLKSLRAFVKTSNPKLGDRANLYKAVSSATRILTNRQLKGDANNVVLFSKVKPIIKSGKRWIESVTKRYFRDGGSISAISLDKINNAALTRVTGDAGKVLLMDDFFDLGEIIYATVVDVCSMYESKNIKPEDKVIPPKKRV